MWNLQNASPLTENSNVTMLETKPDFVSFIIHLIEDKTITNLKNIDCLVVFCFTLPKKTDNKNILN